MGGQVKIVVDDELFLKSLELREAEELLLLVNANRSYLREWLPWLDLTRSIDEMIVFIESTLRQNAGNQGFQTAIWHQGQIVGIIGYHHLEWANRSTCIGYWLDQRSQGKGFMTKACHTLVDYAFNEWKLNRIEIRCAEGNRKSRGIPERLGFKAEGLLREAEWLYDHYVDHVVYGMLAKDWFEARGVVSRPQTLAVHPAQAATQQKL
jgi:ribosomal-protein-serine acetyltransferase